MARYKVINNGAVINTIEADAKFAMLYGETTGYTLELIPEDEPEPTTTLEDRVTNLETPKADKADVENIWNELAAAYTEGVNSI
jgi:hypothetical protein